MSRNGSGVYSLPALPADTETIDAADVNTPLQDLETDANTARPVVAGGTGATTPSGARTNLGAQAQGDVLDDLNTLGAASADGEFIVATGAGAFAYESGATVRASLGLTPGTDVQAYDAGAASLFGLTNVAGDTLYNTADNTFARLPIGTAGQVLTVNSGATAPEWAAAPDDALVFITSTDLSNDATADFTAFDAASYDAYLFVLQNVVPATDNVSLYFRTSTDGGATYDSGASDYTWDSAVSGSTANAISLNSVTINIGSAAGEDGLSGRLMVLGPHLTKETMIEYNVGWVRTTGGFAHDVGAGKRNSSADVDAVRFVFSSGALESGTITMYGLRNA